MQVCRVAEWIRILDEKSLLTSLEHTHMPLAPHFGKCLNPILKNSMCTSSPSTSFCCASKKREERWNDGCASKSLKKTLFASYVYRSLCNFLFECFLKNFSSFCSKTEKSEEKKNTERRSWEINVVLRADSWASFFLKLSLLHFNWRWHKYLSRRLSLSFKLLWLTSLCGLVMI